MRKNKILTFAASLERLALCGAALLSLLVAARVVFALLFVPSSVLHNFSTDLPLMLFNALRFDLQTVSYILMVPSVLAFGLLFDSAKGRYKKWLLRFIRIYLTIATLLLLVIEIVDIGFYKNFNTHINITLFDFFNEGPAGLVRTMWEEYPVVWLTILIIFVVLIAWNVWCRMVKFDKMYVGWWFIPLYLVVLPCCMRGSLKLFPLRVEDTVVSPCKFVNDMTPNGIYMLKKAFRDKSKAFDFQETDKILSEHGFMTLQDALNAWSGDSSILTNDTLQSVENVLYTRAGTPATSQKPNILIIIGESWSNYLMDLDAPDNDLLGAMRRHLSEDLLWRNFQSVRNNTIATMEMMTLATPFPRFFTSKYRYTRMPSSFAIPFIANGYNCEWISGMDPGWENCNEVLHAQGFTDIIGKYELLREHPDYSYNTHGIFDEFLFDAILERLNKSRNKPVVMLAMSTTNHPPFIFPSGHSFAKLSDDFYDNKCFNHTEKDVLEKYIQGFQYYNNVLGDFLTKFKKSKAAANTIIVATGDHNVRSILDYGTVPICRKYAVPLYMFLPQTLRNEAYPRCSDVWGCHYDVLPTIAKYAFNEGTKFLNLGSDMQDTTAFHYSYNEEQVLADDANRQKAEKKGRALEVLLRIYFQEILQKETHNVKAHRE